MKNDFYPEIINFIAPELIKNVIYDTENGYVLFEKYEISRNGDIYKALRYTDQEIFIFSKLRNAASWCILDKYNKIVESQRILNLDRILASIRAEIEVHRKLQLVGSAESREISRDKYLVDIDKQKRFQWELDKYIILAKNCQNRGYQNELTRIARK